jgi:hypothetical protein
MLLFSHTRFFSENYLYILSSVYTNKKLYSLRPIILFANVDVSRYILVVDTSVLAKSNMGRREYINSINSDPI